MKVLLIRHGDPDYARDALTERGHAEAEALAEHLRATRIDDIYVSPMGRAQATASYTAHAQRRQAVTLDWLHELDGNYEGGRWAWNVPGAEVLAGAELPSHHNWADVTAYGPHMLPAQAGVSAEFDALIKRYGYVREGHRYRVRRSCDKTIALFCHAGVCYSLISHLLNWPLPLVYSHLDYDPTGLTRIRWEEHEGYAAPKAECINDTSHLLRLKDEPA